jgi:AcrR family transcriptional regulator
MENSEVVITSAPSTAADSRTAEQAKRHQILEGACRIFLAHGFDAASMGAIAREAGVSKGTLYVYFKSKEELFEAIVDEQRRQQSEQIFNLDDTTEIEPALRRMGEQLVRYLCRPGGIPTLRTVIAIAERMPEVGARFYQSGPARGIGSLKHFLDKKIEAGVLRPHDSEVAAAQFIDSCLSLNYKPMLFNAAGPPPDEQIAYIVGIAVQTFMAAYGKH